MTRISYPYQSVLPVSSLAYDDAREAEGWLDLWDAKTAPFYHRPHYGYAHTVAERDHDMLVTGALPSEL